MAFPSYNHPYQQHQQHQGVINSGHTHPTTSWNPTAPHLGSTFTSPEFHPHFPSSHQPSAPVGASPPGQMDTSSSYLPAYLLGGSPAPRSVSITVCLFLAPLPNSVSFPCLASPIDRDPVPTTSVDSMHHEFQILT